MPAVSYFIDRSGSPYGEYQELSDDFVSNFVNAAKRNGTFELYREHGRPDMFFMRGTDSQHRRLVGAWSVHPAAIIDDTRLIVFREITQDQHQQP